MKTVPCALFALLAGAAGTACSEPDKILSGQWGGDHVSLSIGDSAAAVEFDCAHGSVNEAIVRDGEGRFDARGRYVREHGGPVRPDEPEDTQPARYTGAVEGRSMSLTVLLEDGGSVGPFGLTMGDEGRLLKCL